MTKSSNVFEKKKPIGSSVEDFLKKKKDHTDNYDVSYKVTNVTEYERVRPALQSTALRQTALGGQTRII